MGEVGLCAITRTVYAEAAGVLADYLAPHQVAVGVPGGLDILVHGVRAFLRAQPEHVVVRLDLRNAYNEIDRCVALRRLAAVPELAHLAPVDLDGEVQVEQHDLRARIVASKQRKTRGAPKSPSD